MLWLVLVAGLDGRSVGEGTVAPLAHSPDTIDHVDYAVRPSSEPGDGREALRVDGGGWTMRASPSEIPNIQVVRSEDGFGVALDLSPSAAERLRSVSIVTRQSTMTIRICGDVVARPINWSPIDDGHLLILGSATQAEAEHWAARLGPGGCEAS